MLHPNAINSMFLEVRTAENLFYKRGRLIVHSSAIWNDVLEVWTAEIIIQVA